MAGFILRLIKLNTGLFLYALGIVFTIKANIGYAPWEVFHIGVSIAAGLSLGTVVILTGAAIVVITFLMGEKIGLGTLLNMVIIGIFIDIILCIKSIPVITSWIAGIFVLIAGLFIIAFASFLYIGSGMGSGPRDSLMVALTRKTGLPVGLCRGAIELAAVIIGWLLGGMVGAGTIISAFAIGLCIQVTFKLLKFRPADIQHEDLSETFRNLFDGQSHE